MCLISSYVVLSYLTFNLILSYLILLRPVTGLIGIGCILICCHLIEDVSEKKEVCYFCQIDLSSRMNQICIFFIDIGFQKEHCMYHHKRPPGSRMVKSNKRPPVSIIITRGPLVAGQLIAMHRNHERRAACNLQSCNRKHYDCLLSHRRIIVYSEDN